MRQCSQLLFLCLSFLVFIANAKTEVSKSLPYVLGSSKPISVDLKHLPWKKNPDGSQYVYMYGNPSKPGLFILIAKDIPGYKNLPHYHDKPVFVILLQGSFHVGYGKQFIKKDAILIKPTNFMVNPPGVAHYEWTDTGAITQVIGIGPWKTHYLKKS